MKMSVMHINNYITRSYFNFIQKKTFKVAAGCLVAGTLASCNVHEWPEPDPSVPFIIRLQYTTDFPILEHNLTTTRDPEGIDLISRHTQVEKGIMRYFFKAYPLKDGEIESRDLFTSYSEEWSVEDGYDRDFILNLEPGDYRVMVWADLRENPTDDFFYEIADYHEITLRRHLGNNDYRDCFRGSIDITVTSSIEFTLPEQATVNMERPMAKFEFLTSDLSEFINNAVEEYVRSREGIESELGDDTRREDDPDTRMPDISDYKVKFYYVGFMPTAYSMFEDKPSDSQVNRSFDSSLTKLNENQASMGFDYVFVNHNQTSVSLQIAISDKDDNIISLSDAIDVPLKRSNHTVITGNFLTMDANGEVGINPDFDGDWNIIL